MTAAPVSDADLIEHSLLAAAEADPGDSLWRDIFERFFDEFPDRRSSFYSLEAAGPRMVNETLGMLHGLAQEERWVWYQLSSLVFTHRNYGDLPLAEYDAFIDRTIDALSSLAVAAWTADCSAAWSRQAGRLKAMIREAR